MMARIYLSILCVASVLSCSAPRAKKDPVSASTYALIREGNGFEKQRRYDRARERYQKALSTAPNAASRAHAARSLARALGFWGEYQGAASALVTAVTNDPSNAADWHDLGILRAKLGDAAGSEVALRRARKLAPGDPRPRIALAALLVNQKRIPEAEQEYRKLRELDLPAKLRDAVDRALELLAAERRRMNP